MMPTTNTDLNQVLLQLVHHLQDVLQDDLVSVYLQGSFGLGNWDEHSDVDVSIVVQNELDENTIGKLQHMHADLFGLASPWAQHLEGSYFPCAVLDKVNLDTPLWYLDNGSSQLIQSTHDNTLVVRWVTREHGISLFGPPANTLIPLVEATSLKQEVKTTMHTWSHRIFAGSYTIANQWAQPFAVVSYCRMLHTLATGRIDSKPAGAQWAQQALDSKWHELISQSWEARPNPSLKVKQPARDEDIAATKAFIRYALERAEDMINS
ncbi:MAG: aminoglycoside adenylyltransferase domain-containing protein [Deinococcota bacterium]